MKTIVTILAFTFAIYNANAQTVKLKITYKGDGLDGHTVTVLAGNVELGSGETDGSGNVSISVSSLPSKTINLRGEKKCNNAQKSWSADGYVTLDGSNSGTLKMEELTKMMADASGGFLTEEGLAASYGLVCPVGGKEEEESSIVPDSSRAGNAINTANNFADLYKQREEQLANKKEFYTTKLQTLDGKIERKYKKMEKYDEKEKQEALYEIREWQIEKKMTLNDLDKTNTQMSHKKQILNKEERQEFDDREELLKGELEDLEADKKAGKPISEELVKAEMAAAEKKSEEKKEDGKNETAKEDVKVKNKKEEEKDDEDEDESKNEQKEKSMKEKERELEEKEKALEERAKALEKEEQEKAKQTEKDKAKAEEEAAKEKLKQEEEDKKKAEEEKEKAEKEAREDLIYTTEEFANMSKGDLVKEKIGLKTDLNKLDIRLTTRKNSMTPTELAEAEARFAKIQAAIKSIEDEQARREKEEEAKDAEKEKETETEKK